MSPSASLRPRTALVLGWRRALPCGDGQQQGHGYHDGQDQRQPEPAHGDPNTLLGKPVSVLLSGTPVLSLPRRTARGACSSQAPSSSRRAPRRGRSSVPRRHPEQHRRQKEQRVFGAASWRSRRSSGAVSPGDLHDDPLQTLIILFRGLDNLAGDSRLPTDLADQVRGDARPAADVGVVALQGDPWPAATGPGQPRPGLHAMSARRRGHYPAGGADHPAPRRRWTGRLAPQTELTAYRVVPESLSNVLRRADAGEGRVRGRAPFWAHHC